MTVSIASFSLNFRWNVQPSEFPLLIVWIMHESIDTLIKFIAFERFEIEIYFDIRHFTSILCRVAWNKPSDSIQSIFHAIHSKRVAFEWSIYSSSEREYASIKSTLYKWKHTVRIDQFRVEEFRNRNSWAACRVTNCFWHCAEKAFPPLTLLLQFKYSTQVYSSVGKETKEQHLTSPNNNIHNYMFGPSMHIFIFCVVFVLFFLYAFRLAIPIQDDFTDYMYPNRTESFCFFFRSIVF